MSLPEPMAGADTVQCRLLPATTGRPGAIAILQLHGDVEPLLAALTGVAPWPMARARLVRFGDIDEGLAVRIRSDVAQVMPHGGPRVVQRLIQRMLELGVELIAGDDVPPEAIYPEADDRYEALTLGAIARAASPLAIDLLLDQSRRWRRFTPPPSREGGREEGRALLKNQDIVRSKRLNRLIEPPIVVVAGAANVGKSTLSNALLGRSMSIAADVAGTTRDYTSGRIELAGLVVDWHDTPGLRPTRNPIESKAIDLARRLVKRADCVIAMTDLEHDWPTLPREPDLRVLNKVDLLPSPSGRGAGGEGNPSASRSVSGPSDLHAAADLRISALHTTGLSDLVTTVRDRLVPPADLAHPGPWLFDNRLTQSV